MPAAGGAIVLDAEPPERDQRDEQHAEAFACVVRGECHPSVAALTGAVRLRGVAAAVVAGPDAVERVGHLASCTGGPGGPSSRAHGSVTAAGSKPEYVPV